jgi:MFS family permease
MMFSNKRRATNSNLNENYNDINETSFSESEAIIDTEALGRRAKTYEAISKNQDKIRNATRRDREQTDNDEAGVENQSSHLTDDGRENMVPSAQMHKWTTFISLLILSLLNLLNYIDRYIVGSILIDVESYFNINKSTSGLLHTLFLLSFTLVAPLVGYLGDRYKRRKYLLIGSCLVWFLSISAASFTTSSQFILFLLLRCLFGASTAFYECISLPIISDLYKTDSRARTRALFLFYLGPPLGVGLAFLIANTIGDLIPSDWRYAMRFTPILLIFLLILIVFVFKEPERSRGTSKQPRTLESGKLWKQLLKNKTYVLTVLSASLAVCTVVGFSWWSPSYITYMLKANGKTSNEKIYELRQVYSFFQVLSGLLGSLVPSELSNFLKHKFVNAPAIDGALLAASLFSGSLGLFVYFLFSNVNFYLDVFFYSLFTFFMNMWRVLVANILLDVVDATHRAFANSILLFSLHLIGDAFAPYWIGLINDECFAASVKTVGNLFLCTQYSLYPLVFTSFLGASCALFSTITYANDKIN